MLHFFFNEGFPKVISIFANYSLLGRHGGPEAPESHEDYFSPLTSSFSSPQVSVDSPRISFSPLQIKDSIEEEEEEEERCRAPANIRQMNTLQSE